MNRKQQFKRGFSLVSPLLKKYRFRIAKGFLCLVGVNIVQLSVPRLTKRAVDGLQSATISTHGLINIAFLILLFGAIIMACRYGWRVLIIGFSRILERDIRDHLMRHLLTLDKSFFQKHTTGEIMALATNDLSSVQLAFGMGMIAAADALFMTIATIGFMLYIHPGLTVLAILPMPVLAITTLILSARLHVRFRKVQEQFGQITEFCRTSFSTIRLLKAYTQEKPQEKYFNALGNHYIRSNLKLALVQGTLYPFAGLAGNTSLLLIVYFGGKLTISQTISIGDFVAFMSYLFMLVWPMMALGWVSNLFQRGLTSLERLQNILAAIPVLQEPINPQSIADFPQPTICIRNLTFSYAPALDPVLKNFSFCFKAGLTGIVGRTGIGKSTLCQIIADLYPLAKGKLFLNNQDIIELAPDTVRKYIAYVPQESVLFSDTIAANIRYGKPEADKEEIIKVAQMAMLHDEIEEMPDGYATTIGEKGVKLSGGQRQRLTLARALLMKRPVFLIDDGLSAVDSQTESAIIEQLAAFSSATITIFVSHRLAPLVNADTILVVDDGTIIDQGTHHELLQNNTYYQNIFSHQKTGEGQ